MALCWGHLSHKSLQEVKHTCTNLSNCTVKRSMGDKISDEVEPLLWLQYNLFTHFYTSNNFIKNCPQKLLSTIRKMIIAVTFHMQLVCVAPPCRLLLPRGWDSFSVIIINYFYDARSPPHNTKAPPKVVCVFFHFFNWIEFICVSVFKGYIYVHFYMYYALICQWVSRL